MIETDYLVVGAGAAGLAFTDALIEESDDEVVMVDRRHTPGGHWNDAYPFVRLHQPSAYYGVNSRMLGNDRIDETGDNKGLYERATAPQICDYFQRVMDEKLLATDQVRFMALTDYLDDLSDDGPTTADVGEHTVRSRLTGATTTVKVRKRVVDARYLEPSIPKTHTPSFEVDPDVRFVPVNDLAKVAEPATVYTIIGAGKTGFDACTWLLDNGVDPDRIRWIRPRETWFLDRASWQPLSLVTSLIDTWSRGTQAAAEAENLDDLFARLEACGHLVRLDATRVPEVYRMAFVSRGEHEQLLSIENVVRLGHVKHIGTDEITLDGGTIPTDRSQLHVDCSAHGLRLAPARPIFEPGRITLQPIRLGVPPFNAAISAYIEATRDDDREKCRLCPPNPYPRVAADWLPNMRITIEALMRWTEQADVNEWMERSRTNLARGFLDYATEPRMQEAIGRMITYTDPAVENLTKLEALSVN